MTYPESLHYLQSFLNLERIALPQARYAWNLKRMELLLDWFGHPEKSYFSFLITGTKGKGSTGFFIESILNESRIPCGFYTSPHLETPRERIRISGRMISEKLWAWGIREIRRVLDKKKLPAKMGAFTYFEITTLLAVLVFKKQKVKIGIFEVGMGGRLDATNALRPRLAVLTPIHMDHEAVLGNTLAKIAYEKAAIIHPRAEVVCGPQRKEAMRVIRRQVRKQKAAFFAASPISYEAGLKGKHQRLNAGIALRTARLLKEGHGFPLSEKALRRGLQAKEWAGRFELYKGRPSFLLDGAHNPVSAEALVSALKQYYPRLDRILIFGTSRDKKSGPMLRALGQYFETVILAPTPNPRSKEVASLMTEAKPYFKAILPAKSAEEAVSLAKKLADAESLVVLTGSFYLIGEGRKLLKHA